MDDCSAKGSGDSGIFELRVVVHFELKSAEQGQIYRTHRQLSIISHAVELRDHLTERPRVVRGWQRLREFTDELSNTEGEEFLQHTQFERFHLKQRWGTYVCRPNRRRSSSSIWIRSRADDCPGVCRKNEGCAPGVQAAIAVWLLRRAWLRFHKVKPDSGQ